MAPATARRGAARDEPPDCPGGAGQLLDGPPLLETHISPRCTAFDRAFGVGDDVVAYTYRLAEASR